MVLRRVLVIGVAIWSLSPRGVSAQMADGDYFARFYRPGALQRYLSRTLLAQNQTTRSREAETKEPKTDAEPAPTTEPSPEGGLEPPPSGEELGGFSLDAPTLGAPPGGEGAQAGGGVGGNLVFGGTLDYRFLFPREMKSGMYMIHVNELFCTTNIGDHISILAEQLLLTSDVGTVVGQDHGFVYATFSDLPFLFDGIAIRSGRLRVKYGVDAKLDAPANPIRTPEYRTIGILSDRAIEISGYFKFIDFVAAIAMGPDFVLREVASPDGNVAGTIKVPKDTDLHPIYVRIGTDFKGQAPNLGLSFFYGETYPVLAADGFQAGDAMLFGGFFDQSRTVLKDRVTLDVRWSRWKLKLAAEATVGRDHEEVTAGDDATVQAYYLRADLTLKPQKMTVQVQYDRFLDGRQETPNVGAIGATFTYHLTDESWWRAFFQGNERLFFGEEAAWLAGSQILMAF